MIFWRYESQSQKLIRQETALNEEVEDKLLLKKNPKTFPRTWNQPNKILQVHHMLQAFV